MRDDLRFAVRRVFGSPVFSLCVIAILAIGIGSATTMGSVLYGLQYRPLALPHPETLVAVTTIDARGSTRITPLPTIERMRAAGFAADGWCAQNSVVESTQANGRMSRGWVDLMAGDCLTVLGIEPLLGRWFSPDEAPLTGKGQPVVVITDQFWQRVFDRRPDVLGREVRILDTTATVIGVLPAAYTGFDADGSSDFIIPFNAHRQASGGLRYMGRLRPDATIEQLRAQVGAAWSSILENVVAPGPSRDQALEEWRGNADAVPQGFSILRRLYAVPVRNLTLLTLALLILVCVNVGALMVTRFSARSHEIAAMRALGANARRLAVPMAAEALLLAACGTALAVPIAYAASRGFTQLFPTGNTPWTVSTTPSAAVLGVVAGALLIVSAAISAVPIWLALRRPHGAPHLRTASRTTNRWAHGMLISQIAVTIMLVFTSALVVRSFAGLLSVDRGFRADHLLSLRLGAVPGGYRGMDASTYYPALVQRVSTLPGVQSVGLARYFGTINAQMIEQPIGFVDAAGDASSAGMDFVSPGFFSTIGVPLRGGRDIDWSDTPSAPHVAVITESVARQLAPLGDAIGKTIRYGSATAYSRLLIVGVVGDFSIGNVRKTHERMIYVSAIQSGETVSATLHIRTAGPPLLTAESAASTVAAMGREHATGAYSDVLFGNSMVAERMGSAVSVVVGAIALAISCIGVFALLSNAVRQRTREIGIRVAVGATPHAISSMIMREAGLLLAAGLAIGIPSALAAGRLVRTLLYNVTVTDGMTLVASIGLLAATALLAAARPTWQAVRVDPATALRAE